MLVVQMVRRADDDGINVAAIDQVLIIGVGVLHVEGVRHLLQLGHITPAHGCKFSTAVIDYVRTVASRGKPTGADYTKTDDFRKRVHRLFLVPTAAG